MISFISLCKMLYLLIINIMPRLSKYLEQCNKLIWKVGRRSKIVDHELKMNCFKQNNTKFYELTCKTTAGFIVVLSWQCMCKSKMHIIPLDSSAVTFSSVVLMH